MDVPVVGEEGANGRRTPAARLPACSVHDLGRGKERIERKKEKAGRRRVLWGCGRKGTGGGLGAERRRRTRGNVKGKCVVSAEHRPLV